LAKKLSHIAKFMGKSAVDDQIKPILSKMAEDSDKDVVYFAQESYANILNPPKEVNEEKKQS